MVTRDAWFSHISNFTAEPKDKSKFLKWKLLPLHICISKIINSLTNKGKSHEFSRFKIF